MPRLIWQDYLVIATIAMQIIAHTATTFNIATVAAATTAAVELEANPVARKALNDANQWFLILIISTGATLGSYMYLRQHRYKRIGNFIMHIAIGVLFFEALWMSSNDLSIAIKFMLEG